MWKCESINFKLSGSEHSLTPLLMSMGQYTTSLLQVQQLCRYVKGKNLYQL